MSGNTLFDNDIENLLKEWNKARRAHGKNDWLFFLGRIHGETVEIKSFGTWIQRVRFMGYEDSSTVDQNVGEALQWLDLALRRLWRRGCVQPLDSSG
jgi:hypothetical protein